MIFYRSPRIGKNGEPFLMLKFRTLKEGTDKISSFATEGEYTWCGKFLRKYKLDEFPQIWNVLRGEMNLIGPRPEEHRSISLIPQHMRDALLSVRPGMTSLSSVYFFDEESILQQSEDPFKDYWEKIKPIKMTLDIFYAQNKGFFFDCAILWMTFKQMVKALFK
jgi:lipopolysaccharide/colanic/teichoic acid biosynthesis glycosyltransferase